MQVPPGLMRNKLYGRGFAVYVTPTESGGVVSRKIVSPLDTSFGKRKGVIIPVEHVPDQKKAEKFPSGERRLNLKKVPELEVLSVRISQFFHKLGDKIC